MTGLCFWPKHSDWICNCKMTAWAQCFCQGKGLLFTFGNDLVTWRPLGTSNGYTLACTGLLMDIKEHIITALWKKKHEHLGMTDMQKRLLPAFLMNTEGYPWPSEARVSKLWFTANVRKVSSIKQSTNLYRAESSCDQITLNKTAN